MNWSKVKALNSTVGTKNFKPLDVLIGEKLDSLNGRMIPIEFEEKTFDFAPFGVRDFDVGFVIDTTKWYSVECKISLRDQNANKTAKYVFLRTNPFIIDGNSTIFSFYSTFNLDTADGLNRKNAYVEFYVDKYYNLRVEIMPLDRFLSYEGNLGGSIAIKKIYEVI